MVRTQNTIFLLILSLLSVIVFSSFDGYGGHINPDLIQAMKANALDIKNTSVLMTSLNTAEKEKVEDAKEEAVQEEELPPKEEILKSTPDISVNPNEIGDIMIIMYHKIVTYDTNTNLERNADDFRSDLQRLYDEGYRLITMNDLVNNTIDIEAGKTPVILTFDDGFSSAFSLENVDGVLVPKENTGVSIINEFYEKNPDFGKTAVFYINGYMEPFKGDGTLRERFDYLIQNGYELGNHTYSHADLSRLSSYYIQNQIASLDQYVRDVNPEIKMDTFCYPYGKRNLSEKDLALKGESEGVAYEYKMALRAGPSDASANPNSINYDPLNIPRVRGTNNAARDLWWFLDYYRDNPHLKYISDGDSNTLSVHKSNESKVNTANLGHKVLNVYGAEN